MEKRNRLHRRGQSPPPDDSKVTATRAVAALTLAAAFVLVVLVVITHLGVGKSLLVGAGLSSAGFATFGAWVKLRTALVNYEVAKLNLRAAEQMSPSPADGDDSGS